MVKSFLDVHSKLGDAKESIALVTVFRSLLAKNLLASMDQGIAMFFGVYHQNGTYSGTLELFKFLADRAADAYEFKAGIEMYQRDYPGSHQTAMTQLKSIW